MHFGQNAKDEYFKGLTCEKLVTTIDSRGFEQSEWRNEKGARNEPLDLEVYILGMLELVKRNYAAGTMWAQLARTLGTQAPGTGGAAPSSPARDPQRSGWLKGSSTGRPAKRKGWLKR
jgi:phage terminase large subunit GpA-like protein